MINTPQEQEHENTINIQPSNNEELLNTLNEGNKIFSCKLEFVGLDYETRREKVEDVTDEITDFLYQEQFERRNVLMNLLKETIKNSADHSESDMNIKIVLNKNIENGKIHLRFSLYDEWLWLPYEAEYIKRFFDTGETIKDWIKKGKSNYWIWLGIIKAVAETCNIDLILHNKWNIIHLHDLGMQKEEEKEKHTFWYEGVWMFDIVK